MKRQSGFTLLELLISMAIFGFLSAMAYGGLQMVLNQKTVTQAHADRLSQLQTASVLLQRDVEQSMPRSVRDGFGTQEAAMLGATFGKNILTLTRAGWRNPTGQARSQLQRVVYQLDDEVLSRAVWPALDPADASEPMARVLMTGVKQFAVRYLDETKQWHEQWPPLGGQPAGINALPRAVEVKMDIDGVGKVRRLFRVGAQ